MKVYIVTIDRAYVTSDTIDSIAYVNHKQSIHFTMEHVEEWLRQHLPAHVMVRMEPRNNMSQARFSIVQRKKNHRPGYYDGYVHMGMVHDPLYSDVEVGEVLVKDVSLPKKMEELFTLVLGMQPDVLDVVSDFAKEAMGHTGL